MATKAFSAADAAAVDPVLCARGHECKPTEVLNLSGRGIAVIGSLGPIGTTAAPLRRLNLSDNSLTRLTGLHHLPSLTWLDASKNKLVGTALSDLDEMRALVVLSAAHNALKDLPASALRAQASSLKALVLNNNSLRDRDITPLLALTQLNSLVLSHNPRITCLPEAICRLQELTKLSLSHCTLTTLPSGIGSLTRLAELRLNGNALTAAPPALAGCRGLRLLDLGHNRITDLEGLAVLGELPMLANLNLRGNPCCPAGRGGAAARAAAEGSADDEHAAAATADGTVAEVPASAEEIAAYSAALLALCPRLSHLDNQKLARREGQKGGASSRATGKAGAGAAAAGSAHKRAAASSSVKADDERATRSDDEEEGDEAETGASTAPPAARAGGKAARDEPGAARGHAAGKSRTGAHDALRTKGGARTAERPAAATGPTERKPHGREPSSQQPAHARAGAGAGAGVAAADAVSGSKRKRAEIAGHVIQHGKGAPADDLGGRAAEAIAVTAVGGKRARLTEATGGEAGGHLDDHAASRKKAVHFDKRDAGQAEAAADVEGEGKSGQGASRSERRRSKVEKAGLVDKAYNSGSVSSKASRTRAAADAGEGDAQVEYVSASSHAASKAAAAADSTAPGGDFAALVKGQEGVDVVGGWD